MEANEATRDILRRKLRVLREQEADVEQPKIPRWWLEYYFYRKGLGHIPDSFRTVGEAEWDEIQEVLDVKLRKIKPDDNGLIAGGTHGPVG